MASFGSHFWTVISNPNDNEDIFYIISLVSAVIFSCLIPLFSRGHRRSSFVIVFGILNYVIFCRWQCVYLLLSGALTGISIVCNFRLAYSYVLPFAVLFLARALDFLSLVRMSPLTNVSLLLFTLRVVDFAYYVLPVTQNYRCNKCTNEKKSSCYLSPTDEQKTILWLFLCHLTYFPGLWSGPLLPPGHVLSCLLRGPISNHPSPSASPSASPSTSPSTSPSPPWSPSSCITKISNQINIKDDDRFSECSSSTGESEFKFPGRAKSSSSTASSRPPSHNDEVTNRRQQQSVQQPSNQSFNPSTHTLSGPLITTNLHQHYFQECLDFIIVRVYETSFHILVLAIVAPFISHIHKSHPLGRDATKIHNFTLLYEYATVKWSPTLPSIFTPLVCGMKSYFLLSLLHIRFRARFFLAWMLGEISANLSGVRTSETIDVYAAMELWNSKLLSQSLSQNNSSGNSSTDCVPIDCIARLDPSHLKSAPDCPKVLSYVMDQDRYANVHFSSSICRNFDGGKVEFGRSMSEVLRNWNKTVQAWLVRNVYKSYHPKSPMQRRMAVVAVSAFWHGSVVCFRVTA